MNKIERLNLQRMIKENDSPETTEIIRKLKHSKKIKENVDQLVLLMKKYPRMFQDKRESFINIAQNQCFFLYSNYTNLFNRLIKDELDVNILYQFIHILKNIEDGKIDQHGGSYEVGKLLKKLYIDSVIRVDKKKNKKRKKKKKKPIENITWSEYKKKNKIELE